MAETNNATGNKAENRRPKWSLRSKNLLMGYNNIDISNPKTRGIKILLATLSITKTNTTASSVSANLA